MLWYTLYVYICIYIYIYIHRYVYIDISSLAVWSLGALHGSEEGPHPADQRAQLAPVMITHSSNTSNAKNTNNVNYTTTSKTANANTTATDNNSKGSLAIGMASRVSLT